MRLVDLITWGLATWRLSRMLVREAGPYHVFANLRQRTGIEYNQDGSPFSWPDWNPLHCVMCASVWVAAALLLVPRWLRSVLAASAIAVWLEDAPDVSFPGTSE